ncbi:MAG: HAD family phosphatase [Bacteroidota bacterium]
MTYSLKSELDNLNISNIILDLGGVVLDIDYSLTLKAFGEFGIRLSDHSTFTGSNELFNQFDCGLIGPDTFWESFNLMFGVSLNPKDFDRAWNALLLDWDLERLKLIELLRKNYRLFLLSNTNIIHFEHYNQILIEKYGKALKDLFHKAYLSFEMGIRKPQAEIFQRLIDENELVPSETLFIDDTFEHVAAAKKLGILTIHLKGGNRIQPLVKVLKGFVG